MVIFFEKYNQMFYKGCDQWATHGSIGWHLTLAFCDEKQLGWVKPTIFQRGGLVELPCTGTNKFQDFTSPDTPGGAMELEKLISTTTIISVVVICSPLYDLKQPFSLANISEYFLRCLTVFVPSRFLILVLSASYPLWGVSISIMKKRYQLEIPTFQNNITLVLSGLSPVTYFTVLCSAGSNCCKNLHFLLVLFAIVS